MKTISSIRHTTPSPFRKLSQRHLRLSDQTWGCIIEDSFQRFDMFLRRDGWFGRENEVVNSFAHQYLAQHIHRRSPLTSLGQIGIETAVVQVVTGGKQYVRKDLVLWADLRHNPWHSDSPCPAAIVEWKVGKRSRCAADIAWLRRFTRRFPSTIGYSACATMRGARGLWWARTRDAG